MTAIERAKCAICGLAMTRTVGAPGVWLDNTPRPEDANHRHVPVVDERRDLVRYYLLLAHDNHPDGHPGLADELLKRLDKAKKLTKDERRGLD